MLTKISPWLGRTDIMLNSFSSGIPNTPKEFSRAPEMPLGEISSKPRMFLQKLKCRVALKQLQCPADRHCGGDFNKQMDMVNCNVKLIDLASMPECNLPYKPLTVHSDSMELKCVHGIFGLPYKMEGILPEGMLKGLKVHFFAPPSIARSKAHAKSVNLVFERDVHSHPSNFNQFQELNFREDGNSSLCLKAEVSLPFK
jgi:hypothetical protein